MTNNAELIRIIQAEMTGSIIEYENTGGRWVEKSIGSEWRSNYNYRVKASPREWWVNQFENGQTGEFLYSSLAAARYAAPDTTVQIKVVEVLDDE